MYLHQSGNQLTIAKDFGERGDPLRSFDEPAARRVFVSQRSKMKPNV